MNIARFPPGFGAVCELGQSFTSILANCLAWGDLSANHVFGQHRYRQPPHGLEPPSGLHQHPSLAGVVSDRAERAVTPYTVAQDISGPSYAHGLARGEHRHLPTNVSVR